MNSQMYFDMGGGVTMLYYTKDISMNNGNNDL